MQGKEVNVTLGDIKHSTIGISKTSVANTVVMDGNGGRDARKRQLQQTYTVSTAFVWSHAVCHGGKQYFR